MLTFARAYLITWGLFVLGGIMFFFESGLAPLTPLVAVYLFWMIREYRERPKLPRNFDKEFEAWLDQKSRP